MTWLLARMRPAFRVGLAVAAMLIAAPFVVHATNHGRNRLVARELDNQEAASDRSYRLDVAQVHPVTLPAVFTPVSDGATCPDPTLGILRCWRFADDPVAALPALAGAMASVGLAQTERTCDRLPSAGAIDPARRIGCRVSANVRGHRIELVAVPHVAFPKTVVRPSPGQALRLPHGKANGTQIELVVV
jgi:hypothetical protein